jgi:hypothetical protein
MTKPIEDERRLEAEGFRLGTAHRKQGKANADAIRELWPASFRAGYEAGLLSDGSQAALQVMLACHSSLPMADLRGDLTAAGLIGERGLLTDRGQAIARILLALT